jgi:hypothetical protein
VITSSGNVFADIELHQLDQAERNSKPTFRTADYTSSQ